MKCNSDIIDIPVFFILGRTRSGTTMLRTMFDAHPNVAIPPEFPVLQNLLQFVEMEWNVQTIDKFVDIVAKSVKYENLKLSAEEVRDSFLSYFNEKGTLDLDTAYRILQTLYKSPYQKENLLAIGDKNPLYSLNVLRLRRLFPNAKFIFLRRHLLSVVDSVAKVDFELHWASFIAWKWRKAFQMSRREIENNPSLNIVCLYEDILKDEDFELKRICEFLDLPFASQMLSFNDGEKLKSVFGKEVDGVHASLQKKVSAVKVKTWLPPFSVKHKIAIAWAGKSLYQAGYEKLHVRNAWFYYLLGLPAFVFARLVQLFGLSIRKLSGGKIQGTLLHRLALFLYKKK